MLFRPLGQAAAPVGRVRADQLQPKAGGLGYQEQVLGRVPVLDVGRQARDADQQAFGVHQQVPLAAPD
jgi:hypothetical protein